MPLSTHCSVRTQGKLHFRSMFACQSLVGQLGTSAKIRCCLVTPTKQATIHPVDVWTDQKYALLNAKQPLRPNTAVYVLMTDYLDEPVSHAWKQQAVVLLESKSPVSITAAYALLPRIPPADAQMSPKKALHSIYTVNSVPQKILVGTAKQLAMRICTRRSS